MTTSELTIVFVYGTLRKGFHNHQLLTRARFLGGAKTQAEYALYVAEDGIPYLFKGRRICQIMGEVYEVDPLTLARLDELEQHDYEYQREKAVVTLSNGSDLEAWIYFYPRQFGKLHANGDYATYTS